MLDHRLRCSQAWRRYCPADLTCSSGRAGGHHEHNRVPEGEQKKVGSGARVRSTAGLFASVGRILGRGAPPRLAHGRGQRVEVKCSPGSGVGSSIRRRKPTTIEAAFRAAMGKRPHPASRRYELTPREGDLVVPSATRARFAALARCCTRPNGRKTPTVWLTRTAFQPPRAQGRQLITRLAAPPHGPQRRRSGRSAHRVGARGVVKTRRQRSKLARSWGWSRWSIPSSPTTGPRCAADAATDQDVAHHSRPTAETRRILHATLMEWAASARDGRPHPAYSPVPGRKDESAG